MDHTFSLVWHLKSFMSWPLVLLVSLKLKKFAGSILVSIKYLVDLNKLTMLASTKHKSRDFNLN